mmetsp:Transcript_53375/g.155570  ORF Transcript_53375/g.155570 Transcript_53375/m.155570 type:complete len:441 (-) Transcript_53375:36-1358(-)
MAGATEEALALKEKGNAAFKASDYDEAIDAYSKALELDQTQHLCFSNRSAAYLKLGCKSGTAEASKADFLEKALADADKCVEINPAWAKGYSRQAAVLQELKRWDDAIAACQKGLDLGHDAALEKMRNEVVNRRFQSQLIGIWHGTVDEVLGGYDQEMEFLDEKSVRVQVLGRSIVGTYWVDAGQSPHHLNIQVPMAEAPGMPPPPPVPYIAKIDSDGLHICCPFMKMDRPTQFDGPGYCLMQSGSLNQVAEGAETANLSPEQQLVECAKDLAKALPDTKIEDLSQTDSEEATRDKLMMQVKFESSMYGVQRKFGEEVMKKVLEATKDGPVPAALAGTPELKCLRDKLGMCGLLDAVQEKAPGAGPGASDSKGKAEEQSAKEQTSRKESKREEKEAERQDPKAAASDSSSALSLQVVCALTLGAAVATVALVWWRRRQMR